MPKNYNQLSDIWWCFLFPFYLHSALLKKKIIKKTMTWFQIPRYWKARMQVLVQLCSQDELKVKAYCQSRTTGYFLIMFLKIKFCKPWGNLCPTRCIWSLLLSFFFFFLSLLLSLPGTTLRNLTHTVVPPHPCAAFLHSNQPGTASRFVPRQY